MKMYFLLLALTAVTQGLLGCAAIERIDERRVKQADEINTRIERSAERAAMADYNQAVSKHQLSMAALATFRTPASAPVIQRPQIDITGLYAIMCKDQDETKAQYCDRLKQQAKRILSGIDPPAPVTANIPQQSGQPIFVFGDANINLNSPAATIDSAADEVPEAAPQYIQPQLMSEQLISGGLNLIGNVARMGTTAWITGQGFELADSLGGKLIDGLTSTREHDHDDANTETSAGSSNNAQFHHTTSGGPDGGKSLVLCEGQPADFDRCYVGNTEIPHHGQDEGRESYWNQHEVPAGDIQCDRDGRTYTFPAAKMVTYGVCE